MATPKSLSALEKSKEAVLVIKERLAPVLQRLTDDTFGEQTGRAQASVALSIGMMRYMGARLRGLDQGRKPDDPLRKDLNNIKRILAKTMKSTKAAAATKTATTSSAAEGKSASHAAKSSPGNVDLSKRKKMQPTTEKKTESVASQQGKKKRRKTNPTSDADVTGVDSASKRVKNK